MEYKAFECSEAQDKFGPAYLEAQKAMGPVVKGKVNPAFKSKYSGYSDVLKIVLPALHENGLTQVCPMVATSREGHVACILRTTHAESGQWQQVYNEIPADKNTSQGYGSGGTYIQRQTNVSYHCLEQEDDDGNAASGHRPVQQVARPVQAPTQAVTTAKAAPIGADRPITVAERVQLNTKRAERDLPAFEEEMSYSEFVEAGRLLMAKKNS